MGRVKSGETPTPVRPRGKSTPLHGGDVLAQSLPARKEGPMAASRRHERQQSTFGQHDAWAFEPTSTYDRQLLEKELERRYIRNKVTGVDPSEDDDTDGSQKKFDLSDPLVLIKQGVESILKDDFTCCFESRRSSPWNWNLYLFPVWAIGVLVRYLILFPVRLFALLAVAFLFAIGFSACFFDRNTERRHRYQRALIRFLCGGFVMSWSGVIKFHGVIPKPGPNQVFVANHSSMIDMIIMGWGMQAFAVVGQKHGGWVGFCQDKILSCLGCIWFNRSESRDRKKVTQRIQNHVRDPHSNPLLLFPEGTCVNNEFCIMFKKGAFELDAVVYPVAIKYNKTFVDAYWNSRQDSFQTHLFRLMTSWCVVCDVWFLDPQTRGEDESTVDFAERCKQLICKKAKLTPVSWDGYLKYFRLGPRFVQEKQKVFARLLRNCRFFSPDTTAATLTSHHPDTDGTVLTSGKGGKAQGERSKLSGHHSRGASNTSGGGGGSQGSTTLSLGRRDASAVRHSVAVMVSRSEVQDHLMESERARAEGHARRRKAKKQAQATLSGESPNLCA